MDDFYCKEVITGNLKVEIIFETSLVMAFHHTKPYFENHVVIIPKAHIDSLSSYPNSPDLNHDLMDAIKAVTTMFEEKFGGCRISSNIGNYQSTKHLHFYVHQGRRLRAENGEPIVK